MDTIEKQELALRTRERSALARFALDYGGIMAPLVRMEADLDLLAGASIENFMAISDEAWSIKEDHRDQTTELAQAEVDQDIFLADAKVATGRAKIAIERSADEYILAARIYEAKVKDLIMGAKEYAALVENEQLAVEESRAELAVDKEGLRLTEVKAKIYLQTIEQAQVEADIAKAQVEVAKANVRAAMAGIEAGEAEIKLIAAQTERYVAEADKASLQADVASIFADIMTKTLTTTKLGVGREEIVASYAYIQSKLDDTLSLYETRGLLEQFKAEAEAKLQLEIEWFSAAEIAEIELRSTEIDNAKQTMEYDKTQTKIYLDLEKLARKRLLEAKTGLITMRSSMVDQKEKAQTNAAKAVSAAQVNARKKQHTAWSWTTSIEHITG